MSGSHLSPAKKCFPATFFLALTFVCTGSQHNSIIASGVAYAQQSKPSLTPPSKAWGGPFVDTALNKKITPAAKDAQLPALQVSLAATGWARVIIGLNIPIKPMGNVSPDVEAAQIVTIADAQKDMLRSLAGQNIRNVKTFKYIPYMAMSVDSATLEVLLANPQVSVIEEDIAVPPALMESVPLIHADTAWRVGHTGSGWTVAVLDTGVDKTHDMLGYGKVLAEACFSTNDAPTGAKSLCPSGNWGDAGPGAAINCNTKMPENPAGCDHGTHVAGIALGQGSSGLGVARASSLTAVQVFTRFEAGSPDCPAGSTLPCIRALSSDIQAGLEYIYGLSATYQIASVNLSIGGGRYFDNCDASFTGVKFAIDRLRSIGIATVIASGNKGYKDSISFPACISTAVSVGATYDSADPRHTVDTVTDYSNSASFLSLLAPGSFITSSIPGGLLGANWNGTSMATPHVAGAWAVIKQKAPTAFVPEILYALQHYGIPITDTNGVTKTRIEVDGACGYYEVLTTAGAGGLVSPPSHVVNVGYNATFTVTPNTGYTTPSTVGGTCPKGGWSGTTYTTGPVTANCSVSFSFTAR